MAYASGKAKAGETKYSYTDWECLTIRKAQDGGFIVERMMPMKNGRYTPSPKPLVFESADPASEYIEECLKGENKNKK